MYKVFLSTVVFVLLIKRAELLFSNNYPNIITVDNDFNDEPLFLTPLIENNEIDEARRAAEVHSELFLNVQSFSGFLTVDKRFNSNLFFWFFPAEDDYKNAPVLLWLQGGPGATSLFALFQENGPFYFKKSNKLMLNKYSWTKKHSVIYIDNPVQTGFSFTEGGFAKNETKVGKDLYEALKQFFTLFPELQNNEFYATGESYAGKYVPAVSYTILKNNPTSNIKINLKGMAIGNGLCDPEHQMKYGEYLYQIGLIDKNGKQEFLENEQKVINYIRSKDFRKAFEIFDDLLNGDLNSGNTLFLRLTGFQYYLNFLNTQNPISDNFNKFIQKENVRKAIHVGNLTFNSGKEVEENLVEDIMDSVAPWITELLSNIRVLFYNGQLDIIVAYPLTVNFLQNLNFSAAEEYKNAARHVWYSNRDLAGYIKQAGNLTEVLVRNAGHMVPVDQPKWALDLISKFTRNEINYNRI